MSARLRHYHLLWHAALAQGHGHAHTIWLWSTAILTLVTAMITALGFGLVPAIGWALCVPAGFALFAWTMLFVPGALGLNTPVNAQLVPGMRARLAELAALLWSGAMALLAAGLFMLSEAPAVHLLLAIAITLGVAGGLHGARGAGVLLALFFGSALFGEYVPGWLLATVRSEAFGVVLVAALAPLGLLAARILFPRAGKRHWAMMAHRADMIQAMETGLQGKGAGNGWANGALLRRAVARRHPRALLMRALGADLTVSTIGGTVGAAVAFAVMHYLAQSGRLPTIQEILASPAHWVFGSGLLLAFLFQAGAIPTWLMRNRGEQALVRLAPAMPAAPGSFNRLLARGLLRQGLILWLFVSAAAILLACAAGIRGMSLVWTACMCCMTLPALALSLRDHARAPSWSIGFMWVFALGLSLIGPLAGAIGFMLFGLPFGLCAMTVAIALAVFLVQRRLRLMVRAPIAFPVGRLD